MSDNTTGVNQHSEMSTAKPVDFSELKQHTLMTESNKFFNQIQLSCRYCESRSSVNSTARSRRNANFVR